MANPTTVEDKVTIVSLVVGMSNITQNANVAALNAIYAEYDNCARMFD